MTDFNWSETLHPSFGQYFKENTVLYRHHTSHQDLVIFENSAFGRVMALDGVVQTTEKDEFIYHEMMVHVPLLTHPNPRRVLIIGGGDGGALREVCQHQCVQHITMVEIDREVIDFCQTYLPKHSAGAYQDPRLTLVIDDGAHFVTHCDQQFDVIISDSTDPIGPGESLFSSQFYAGVQRCLAPDGIFVAQNGVCFLQLEEATTAYQRLGHYFQDVSFYGAAIPTYYGGIMTFAWASSQNYRQFCAATLQQRYEQAKIITRYYNPAIHMASFALPQYLLSALSCD